MARALLPHGPVELAAFALALALYLQRAAARELPIGHVAATGAASVAAARRCRRARDLRRAYERADGSCSSFCSSPAGSASASLLASRAVDSLRAPVLGPARTDHERRDHARSKRRRARPRPARRRDRATRPAALTAGRCGPSLGGRGDGRADAARARSALALVVAIELAVGVLLFGGVLAVLRAPPDAAAPAPRVRAVRAAPVPARRGQAAGPRGHGRVDRQHRARLSRRARPQRPAVRRARADLRRRPGGMEWSINLRCEPRSAVALDAAISAAYPDVRVGRRHAEAPLPRPGALRAPGHVMRFRKERSFVYPLVAADDELASPPLEQIALAQVALGRRRSCASSSPRPPRSSRSSPAGATAATRTSSSARSAGDCPRAA